VSALLAGELLKLRTTRTFAALVAAAVALSLLVTVLLATIPDELDAGDARELLTFDATAFFVLVLGAVGMTGEFRHRTITSSLLAAPDRVRFVAAKLVAYAAAGALLSLVVSVAVAAVSTAILSARGLPTAGVGDVADQLWRNLAVAALSAALGVAVGAVVRTQVVAVVGILVALFVVEPTLLGLAPEVGRFGPFFAAPSGLTGDDGTGEDLLAPGVAALVLAAWVAGLAALGAVLLRARDLT
jgi:uncharacterized membrane protein YcfT